MSRDYLAIAHQYVDDVLNGVRVAGKLEKLACKRYLSDIKRAKSDVDFDYHMDKERAHHACFFIETMPHVKGELARPDKDGNRKKLIMEPWQVFATVNMFGWVSSTGIRRFVYAYIEIAKKNGKSTWAAAIALYMAFVDGEPGAEVYAAATNYEQASIVWKDAKQMVEFMPAFQERFGVKTTQYTIYADHNNSVFKPLSSDKKGTKDGLNVHFAVEDELHAHKDSSMYDIIADGIAARLQPLILAITTAGDDTMGVCYRERTTVVSILESKSVHERYFGLIFCLDKNDDWRDSKNWEKANPSLGASFKIDYLFDKFKKIEIAPSMEALFRQKSLNEWVGSVDSWITSQAWLAAKDVKPEKQFYGVPSFGGLDLAARLDLAGWGKLYPFLANDGKVHWYYYSKQYINERVVRTVDAINGEKRPDLYPVWVNDGWLTETAGASTDFDVIERDVLESHAISPFYQVAYDQHNAHQISSHLSDQGILMVDVAMRWQFLSPAMKWIEVLLMDGRLHHNGDPVLAWCMGNVVVKPDNNGNIFPRKDSPVKKIDAALALIMAASRAMHFDNPSVFDLVAEPDDSAAMDDYLKDFVRVSRR